MRRLVARQHKAIIMEQNTAENLLPIVEGTNIITGDPRAIAVAKFRELADRLEAGEIHGARCEWRVNGAAMVTVELDEREVRFVRTELRDARPNLKAVL